MLLSPPYTQICKTLCARYHGGWHTRHQKQTIFINNKSKFTLNNCTITFDILRNEGTRYLSRQGVTVFQICTSIYISLLTFAISKINISHSRILSDKSNRWSRATDCGQLLIWHDLLNRWSRAIDLVFIGRTYGAHFCIIVFIINSLPQSGSFMFCIIVYYSCFNIRFYN